MRYLIVPLLVASLTFATAQADNGRQARARAKARAPTSRITARWSPSATTAPMNAS